MPIRLSDLRKTADAAIGADGLDSAQVSTIASDAGLVYFNTIDSLPISGLTAGDQAFVQANKKLYISNGTGWFNVGVTANLTPQFDSDINSSFTIADSVTPLVITNPASDSDNPDTIITYGGSFSDSGQFMVSLTRDSSVWTFTPLSADSVYNNVTLGNIPDSNGGSFTYTFTASDGISQATKQITLTYDGLSSPLNAQASFAGSTYGYSGVAGDAPVGGVHRFPFSSGATTTMTQTISQFSPQTPRYAYNRNAGQSATHGYFMSRNTSPSSPYKRTMGYFAFASDTSGNEYSNEFITVARGGTAHNAVGPPDKGNIYNIGGTSYNNVIDRMSTSSTVQNFTDVGDLTYGRMYSLGVSSGGTHAYAHGSGPNHDASNIIEKWPFAVDTNASDVGDLTNPSSYVQGSQSPTHGYSYMQYTPSYGGYGNITKFSFASDGDAVDTGDDLLYPGFAGFTCNTTTHLHIGGHGSPNPTHEADRQIYALASGGNATDGGNQPTGFLNSPSGSSWGGISY